MLFWAHINLPLINLRIYWKEVFDLFLCLTAEMPSQQHQFSIKKANMQFSHCVKFQFKGLPTLTKLRTTFLLQYNLLNYAFRLTFAVFYGYINFNIVNRLFS